MSEDAKIKLGFDYGSNDVVYLKDEDRKHALILGAENSGKTALVGNIISNVIGNTDDSVVYVKNADLEGVIDDLKKDGFPKPVTVVINRITDDTEFDLVDNYLKELGKSGFRFILVSSGIHERQYYESIIGNCSVVLAKHVTGVESELLAKVLGTTTENLRTDPAFRYKLPDGTTGWLEIR